jgi:hypothetical protein
MDNSLMTFGMVWLFVGLAVSVAIFALWIWALVDILRSNFSDVAVKIVWFLLVFFVPLFGFLLYVIVGKSTKVPDAALSSSQKYDDLERVKKLYDSGVLNEAEFEVEKQKIMSQN